MLRKKAVAMQAETARKDGKEVRFIMLSSHGMHDLGTFCRAGEFLALPADSPTEYKRNINSVGTTNWLQVLGVFFPERQFPTELFFYEQ
jgi:hypothetical protein